MIVRAPEPSKVLFLIAGLCFCVCAVDCVSNTVSHWFWVSCAVFNAIIWSQGVAETECTQFFQNQVASVGQSDGHLPVRAPNLPSLFACLELLPKQDPELRLHSSGELTKANNRLPSESQSRLLLTLAANFHLEDYALRPTGTSDRAVAFAGSLRFPALTSILSAGPLFVN